ncbi:hypothetical protein [Xylella fastidiosa]|uniref:Uncharacterized protein n=1 Tax=Xylella fastidiosa subsp. fastidiosa TaxID=644356 RepID=A0AAJ5QYX8_XYLFS|nr:hypothetical protein [Xylella fastidiosa]UIX80902.1 hypothetical protein LZ756_10580 [Xylella fastidiosa subsp. sandyi]WCF27667.1 hypothetical protein OK117_08460 [Xylella fastidiosa subsp. fastidiosa]
MSGYTSAEVTTTETSTPHPTEVSLLPQHRPHPYLTTTRDLACTKIILIVTPTVLIHTCLRSPASTQLKLPQAIALLPW